MPTTIVVHPRAELMPSLPAGPFARLDDRSILSVAGNPARGYRSRDEGMTWEPFDLALPDDRVVVGPTGALLVTPTGTVIVAFADLGAKEWTWSDELKDAPGAWVRK